MTSTDLDTQRPAEVAQQHGALAPFTPTPAEAVSAALEQWVGGMAASVRGAEYIVDTPMCPDSFWPLPAGTKSKFPKQLLPNEDRESYLARRQVAAYTLGAVVRYGLQLGLPPEVAVQGIFTVGGRMSMYAEQMVALVKSQGHGHRVIERTRERCTVEVCRRGDSEWKPFTFTFGDAVAAGYVPRQGPNPANPGTWPDGKPKPGGGNEKYLTDPAAMLYARCSSIACRTEFPDVLRGLVSYEELQDERTTEPITVEVSDAPAPRASAAAILAGASHAPGARAAADTIVRESAPGPDAVPVPAGPPEPEVTRMVMPASKAKLELIAAAFERHGIGGRAAANKAARLQVCTALAGRDVPDARDLTADEAQLILDQVAHEVDGRRVIGEVLGWEVVADVDPAAETDAAAGYPANDPHGEQLADPGDGSDPWAPQQ